MIVTQRPGKRIPQPKLEALLGFWQDILGCADWTIHIEYVDAEVLGLGAAGDVRQNWEQSVAWIRLLDPSEYGTHLMKRDDEATIIHELIHVLMHRWMCHDDTNPLQEEQEAFINKMTRGFVRLLLALGIRE